MAEVLELTQLAQHHRVAQVDVRSGGIHAELDPQWAPLTELALELAPGQRVDGVSGEKASRLAGKSVIRPMLD